MLGLGNKRSLLFYKGSTNVELPIQDLAGGDVTALAAPCCLTQAAESPHRIIPTARESKFRASSFDKSSMSGFAGL